MSQIPAILLPPDEAERLRSIEQYEVLPSLHEVVFDEFVTLTARIFSLPISLIALVDEEVVHYPANHGMPGNVQQPREEALCSAAILHHKAIVYKDVEAEDAPTLTPEAVAAAHQNRLRFYAAAPLCTPDKRRVGSLCVIARQPRVFSPQERSLLEHLAALVSQTVAVRHRSLHEGAGGEQAWHDICVQLREELLALTALVRYLFTRHGTQVPVSNDVLGQVERRLLDLHEVLGEEADGG